MDLTVGICTYRRLEPFRQTLQSLADADAVALDWEVLVIDNAADPQVEQITREFEGRLPLRYLPEPTLGTSHARNRAVRETNAPIILFTDDDVTFDPQWLNRMAATIREHDDCDFWGGRVDPVWGSASIPPWFDMDRCAMLGDCVVQYQRGDQPRYWDAKEDPPFYTANLALRVNRIAEAGYFDTTVGHRGGMRMGMEDSLMVQAIHGLGGKGWYAADAIVHHPVTDDRLTKPYARRFAWRQGWLSTNLYRDNGKVPRWVYRVAGTEVIRGIGRWIKGCVTFDSGLRFTGEIGIIFNFSKLWHSPRSSGTDTSDEPNPTGAKAETGH